MTLTGILIGALLTLHVLVAVLLVLIVLMQRPRSEGLGTAFGGGMADSLFGSSAGNVLTKITTWLGIIFFLTTVSLYSHQGSSTKDTLGSKLKAAAEMSATNAPAATPSVPVAPSITSTNAPSK